MLDQNSQTSETKKSDIAKEDTDDPNEELFQKKSIHIIFFHVIIEKVRVSKNLPYNSGNFTKVSLHSLQHNIFKTNTPTPDIRSKYLE